jgi:vesicle coat complex subunit
MINTTEITKKYGNTIVLTIDNLEIPKGQSFGWLEIMVLEKLLFLTSYWI